MIDHLTQFTFRLHWSPGDNEWEAVCNEIEDLACLHHDPVEALDGALNLVSEFTAGVDA